MPGAAPISAPLTTYADLIWPARTSTGPAAFGRAVALTVAGAALLTLSAKVQVPLPAVPMTLQTLAVLALGAMLGARLALASCALYLAEGALGLPVFATTPPLPAGLSYLAGPTGGFLLGFALAAWLVGLGADRGLVRRPLAFAILLAAASGAMLLTGWAWLAFGVGGTGIGAAKAFGLGVVPFLPGEAIKVALAACALPVVLGGLGRLLRP